jgi:spore germination protein KC
MKRWMITWLLLGCLFTLTGCWNRRELNELGIAVGIGLDKTGNKYKLSIQLVDSGAVAPRKGGSNSAPVSIYQIEADSIYEAVRKLTTVTPRRMYPSHLRILVIGEELAKQGIAQSLDLLARDWEMRSDFYMIIAKGERAENVLKVLTPIEQIPANKLYSSLKASDKLWAPTKIIRLDDFINDYLSDGKNPVISGVRILGDANKGSEVEDRKSTLPSARLQYANLAVFREDRLIGWLNEKESKGLNYLTNNVSSTVGPISCPGQKGSIIMEILRSNTKIKGSIRDGVPYIDITLDSVENIGEVKCDYDLSKSENVHKLEAVAAQSTIDIMNASLKKVQNVYKSDIFGFGDAIHRADKAYWKKNKEHWEDIFPTVKVNYHVKIKIRGQGTLNNSFLQAKKRAES